MRTSNKILLGVFVTILLILSTIHVALYAKYKSGSYVTMQSVEEDRFEKHTINAINRVVVYGLENVELVPGDQYKLEIEKRQSPFLHYSVNGDSLVIHGDSLVKDDRGEERKWRSNQLVRIYMPSGIDLMAFNSNIDLRPAVDSMKAKSYHVELNNDSRLHIPDNDYRDSTFKYIGRLFVDASSSEIECSRFIRFDQLSVNLKDSKFDDGDAEIKSFNHVTCH